ncbi:alpha/beta hydrolase-fold protein [Streptomyces triticirhizae]|uniref:DUF3327 domain-containing protein n=1 Tax=Streptomyces triticirhizae TaxID=2483353 RepID=A0A3M2M1C3_9ACTN|nr:alpha/beta hydrolase-fold protein [Streptomyces triticirhizae]RMI43431.1 DUF3327 domain-containing protein [Streptomyces triticirhizae]
MHLTDTDWQPLPRPAGPPRPVVVARVADPEAARLNGDAIARRVARAGGPEVVRRTAATAEVRFWHHAPEATAVALSASGWWRPQAPDRCDLARVGATGWWTATFRVPADWQATYRFVEHRGATPPPWWKRGLRDPGAPTVADRHNPARHAAARGEDCAVVRVPGVARRPWLAAFATEGAPARELRTGAREPRVRWWAAECDEPLPLLVVLDGEAHTERLATHRVLAGAVATGQLPPLAAVFVDSGPRRPEVLGVPGGRARWIGERLVPRLRRDGLDGRRLTADPARTVVTGSSFGGLTALFTVARTPEVVGAALAQSTSLWRYPERALLAPLVAADRGHRLRLRLQSGRYEGALPELADDLAVRLRERGVDATATVVSGGHDWAWWVPHAIEGAAELLDG